MTNRIPLIVNAGTASLQELPLNDNLTVANSVITGNIYTDGYFYANGQPFSGGGQPIFVTSNVTSVVPGLPLVFEVDYANTQYPGGVFTLVQNAQPGVLTATNVWASGGTSKDQYINFAAGQVNTQNISLTLSLTGGATFNIQSSDTIVIGGSTITGANLLAIGISGTGGVYVIPASSFAGSVQIQPSVTVTMSLSTTGGTKTAQGTTLTTVAPIPFNVSSISGLFPNQTVTDETKDQAFTWTTTGITGTITGGNVTLSGSQTATLSSSGATTGTSQVYDSTVGPFNLSGTYTGLGLHGAGSTTVTVTGQVPVATTFTPLYWKTTTSGSNPNFTPADNHYNVAYAPDTGQGAMTTNVKTNWTWIAIPAAGPGPIPPKFKFDQPPFIGIVTEPVTTYVSQLIGGTYYNVYGWDNFSLAVFVYTTST